MTLSVNDRDLRSGADQGGWPRVTATRAAEILLRSSKPTKAFVAKMVGDSSFSGNLATRLGHHCEPFMVAECCKAFGWAESEVSLGCPTTVGPAELAVPGRTVRWTAATPDALVRLDGPDGPFGLLELKTVGQRSWDADWGGGAHPNRKYVAQLRWQLWVMGAEYGVLVALELGRQTLHRFVVERDSKQEERDAAYCRAFYLEHIVPYVTARAASADGKQG